MNGYKIYIIGFKEDYFEYCFKDFCDKYSALYKKSVFENKLMNLIFRIHTSESTNKIINFPLKSIWFPFFKADKTDEKVCFIFSKSFSWILQYKNGALIRYLKNKYDNCKVVLFTADLISSYYRFDVEFFKKNCDALFHYDLNEAKSNNLIYCRVPYSKVELPNDSIEYDIYFCGRAKNRLEEIYNSYIYFSEMGLKCLYYITDVKENEIRSDLDIIYNRTISYYENLRNVNKAKCILEIVQKQSTGETLRVKEAIAYQKKLITNNYSLVNYCKDNYSNICIYDNIQDVDKLFVLGEMQEWKINEKSDFEIEVEKCLKL